MIYYGKHNINGNDIQSVVKALKSDFLTTGPLVDKFERRMANYVGSKYAVAVSNGTAALHLSYLAAGLEHGDELLTPAMTFASSANGAFFCGAQPVFVDIKENGQIDENLISEKITKKSKLIVPVHYSGLPCDMKKIKKIVDKHNIKIIEDGCHALGAAYNHSNVGSCEYSDMTVFSFHPVKHITTGEGGLITTNSLEFYKKLKLLRTHGITKDDEDFILNKDGPWHQEMLMLGYNYRITDFQCALGISQMDKVDDFIEQRRHVAKVYQEAFKNIDCIETIKEDAFQYNTYHLFPIFLKDKETKLKLFNYLKDKGIVCQVHYIPVYMHPFYQKKGFKKGLCPISEGFYERELSIPIYPGLDIEIQNTIIRNIKEFCMRL